MQVVEYMQTDWRVKEVAKTKKQRNIRVWPWFRAHVPGQGVARHGARFQSSRESSGAPEARLPVAPDVPSASEHGRFGRRNFPQGRRGAGACHAGGRQGLIQAG